MQLFVCLIKVKTEVLPSSSSSSSEEEAREEEETHKTSNLSSQLAEVEVLLTNTLMEVSQRFWGLLTACCDSVDASHRQLLQLSLSLRKPPVVIKLINKNIRCERIQMHSVAIP